MFSKNMPIKIKSRYYVIKEIISGQVILIDQNGNPVVMNIQTLDNAEIPALYELRKNNLSKWFMEATSKELDEQTLKSLIGFESNTEEDNADDMMKRVEMEANKLESEILSRIKEQKLQKAEDTQKQKANDDINTNGIIDNSNVDYRNQGSKDDYNDTKDNGTQQLQAQTQSQLQAQTYDDNKIHGHDVLLHSIAIMMDKAKDWEEIDLHMKIKLPKSFIQFVANTGDEQLYNAVFQYLVDKGLIQKPFFESIISSSTPQENNQNSQDNTPSVDVLELIKNRDKNNID